MTASPMPRSATVDPLRTVEAALLGTLFLGAVAMLSLPAATAGAGWVPLWLVAAPAAALVTSFALRLRRRIETPARIAAAVVRRRRPAMAMATRRRAVASPRTRRLLAAFVLR